uniref:Uncharacterized protein n=1 Tax=Plectus sambesii TaxID=2011161 RepID=A0A914UI01_9BILA
MRVIAAILLVGLFGCAVAQEMIRQCMCDEVEGCKERAKQVAPQCFEICKGKLSAIGNPDAIKQCVESKRDKIMEVKECVMGRIGRVCATDPNQMVPKQDVEALEGDAEQEAHDRFANSPLRNSPLFQGMRAVMGTLKQYGQCVKECMQGATVQCFNGLGCGIAKPAKEELKEALKGCAGEKNPAEMQATCNCFVNQGGVTQLASVCPLIGSMGGMMNGGMNGGGGMGGGGGLLGRLRG